MLPKGYIVPTGEEMFSALKAMGDFLLGNNGIEAASEQDDQVQGAISDSTDDETRNEPELRRKRR